MIVDDYLLYSHQQIDINHPEKYFFRVILIIMTIIVVYGYSVTHQKMLSFASMKA